MKICMKYIIVEATDNLSAGLKIKDEHGKDPPPATKLARGTDSSAG